MSKKVKIILIVVSILLAIFIIVGVLLLKNKREYPKSSITQKSLEGTSSKEVKLSNTSSQKQGDYVLWNISDKVKLEQVRSMANQFDLKEEVAQPGVYYKWGDGKSEILYELDKNTVIFNIVEGIPIQEAEVTGLTISNFVKKYFSEEWEYQVFRNKTLPEGETIYYAKRILENNISLEMRENYQETDYVAVKNGKIIYAKFLLTIFEDSKQIVPIISTSELSNYVNNKSYPKEMYPQYGALQSSVLKEIDYLSDEFEKFDESIGNCKSGSSEIVYLYKRFDQKFLTPVYKLDTECEAEYKNEKYTVPTIIYTNAVDPTYVQID